MFLEITAPLRVLGLSRPSLPHDTVIEFEQTASVPGTNGTSFEISGNGVKPAVQAVRESEFVNDVSFVTNSVAGEIYRLQWDSPLPDFLTRVRDSDGELLSATGMDENWTFTLRFENQAAVSSFFELCKGMNDSINVQKMRANGPPRRSRDSAVTEKQLETLNLAIDSGYFEVPRQQTLNQMADELGISDSAVSQRLRRGIATILNESSVVAPSAPRATLLEH